MDGGAARRAKGTGGSILLRRPRRRSTAGASLNADPVTVEGYRVNVGFGRNEPGSRLPTLTGLRAVAAGLVFMRHVAGLLPPGAQQDQWLRLFGVGLDGVSFFFLLSGFVLAWSYGTGDTPQRFYRRRLARIGPNHLAVWLVSVPLVTWMDGVRPSGSVLASSLTLTQSWVPSAKYYYGVNGVEWSLSCEMFFYLLLPVIIGPLCRRPRLRLTVALASIALATALPLLIRPDVRGLLGTSPPAGWREWALYNFPITRLAEFSLGVVLGIAFREGWRPDIRWPLGAGIGLCGVVASAYVYSVSSVTAVTLLPLAILMVSGAAADLRGVRTVMSSRLWVRLGEWSFAFYLVHQLVIRLIVRSFFGPSVIRLLVWAPMALLTSTCLAAVLFTYLERPAERRLRVVKRPASPGADGKDDRHGSSRLPLSLATSRGDVGTAARSRRSTGIDRRARRFRVGPEQSDSV